MENLYLNTEGQTYVDKVNISIIAQNTKNSQLFSNIYTLQKGVAAAGWTA